MLFIRDIRDFTYNLLGRWSSQNWSEYEKNRPEFDKMIDAELDDFKLDQTINYIRYEIDRCEVQTKRLFLLKKNLKCLETVCLKNKANRIAKKKFEADHPSTSQ